MDEFWHVQEVWERVAGDSAAKESKENLIREGDDLPSFLLKRLEKSESFDSYELSQEIGRDHQQVVGAIKSLQSLGEVSEACWKNDLCISL